MTDEPQNKPLEETTSADDAVQETALDYSTIIDTITDEKYGKIKHISISNEMEKSYLDYAMSVIVARALPDVRDGLKPVHRRILYSMYRSGIHHTGSYKKSARIVGDVLGRYHPHGDAPVYMALVRLAQDFSMRYQLIDGQGNFGCFTGDTKVRLADGTSKSFLELIEDYQKGITHFTFTVGEKNDVRLAPINIPRLTQKNAQILKITLDNGEEIRCTYNHKFMVRDGTYVEAKDLQAGQALMPLYTRLNEGTDKNLQGYEEVYQPESQTWMFTHKLADTYNIDHSVYDKSRGRVRHHKDFNKFNNDPRNIQRLQWQEHRQIHQAHLKEMWQDPAFQKKMKSVLSNLWKDESFRKKTIAATQKENKRRAQDPVFLAKQRQRLDILWQNPEFRQKIQEAALKQNVLLTGTPEQIAFMRERQHAKLLEMWQNPEYRAEQAERMRTISNTLWSDPNHRQHISEISKKRMSLPEEKAKASENAKKMWASPEYWRTKSLQSQAQWQNPEYRELQQPHLQSNGKKTAVKRFLDTCQAVIENGKVLTEDTYNEQRKKIKHNLIPRFNWGVEQLALVQQAITPEAVPSFSEVKQYLNHKVVSVEPAGNADVYDLTIDGTHNFALAAGVFVHNSVDGDSPAAMRYTEARLAKMSKELLTDLDKKTVSFVDNFDGSMQEPTVLPTRLPNLLLMGSEGIAVGMATKIPPHNLTEICNAVLATIEKGKATKLPESEAAKKDKTVNEIDQILATDAKELAGAFSSEITTEELMEYIQGPDFPTGGIIYDFKAIKEAYHTGRGKVVIRAKASIEERAKGGFQIIVTEIPYQVNKARLIMRIADLVRNKKIEGIKDLNDDSDRKGMQITIELKRDAQPKVVLNKLFKYSELQTSFPVNMVALTSDGTPQLMNIKQILMEYIAHRQLVIVRRAQFELQEARARAHILEGLLIALKNLDDVIETIRRSADTDAARTALMTKFGLSEIQATAILEMQLKRLAALERQKIEDEYKALKKIMDDLFVLLSHPDEIVKVIGKETKEMIDLYGDARKTKLIKGKIGEFNEEDLIANEETVITLTETGYIKRQLPSALRSQLRGGKGSIGIKTKEEDVVKNILTASTHDTLLLFTNQGRVFRLKVYEIQESSRQAKGTAVVNLVNLKSEETVQSILVFNEEHDKDKFITLATRSGLVKKTAVKLYDNIRQNGIIAIILKDNDELVWGKLTSGQDHLMLITRQGKSIRFSEKEVKNSQRDTQGVKGIELRPNDYVVGVEAFGTEEETSTDGGKTFHQLLLVTEKGLGKRTELSQYPVQKRAGQGVKVAEITPKTGEVVAAMMVTHDHEEVMITTQTGQMIKLPIDARSIPVLTRPTQGVILMRPKAGDKVVAVALTVGGVGGGEEPPAAT